MKRTELRIMVYVGMAVALAVVLQFVKVLQMPQGGSVSLQSLPILILAFAYGPKIGTLTGMVFGVVQLMTDAYVVHPIQFLLDYPLPFMVLGLAGLWKQNKLAGVAIGYGLRFIMHLLSGVVFFGSYAPEGANVLVYSAVYNGSYLIPEAIITGIISIWLWRRLTRHGIFSVE